MAVLVDEMHRHRNVETGGDLFGLWSHGDVPTIFLASRPGERATRRRLSFQQDVQSHRATEQAVWQKFGVQCVGMWHSHHSIGLEVLSRGDLGRTMRYARRSNRARFVDLLGFHRDHWHLRPFIYQDAGLGRTRATRLEVLPGISPLRAALDGSMEALESAPTGPALRLTVLPSEPQSPLLAPQEGTSDIDPALLKPLVGCGRGPWRAVHAVEQVIAQVVPESLRERLQLDVVDDTTLALRLTKGQGRTLIAMFSFDGSLTLGAWQVVGASPIIGRPQPDDVTSSLQQAIAALESS
ncbi:MAG: hypothetical protein ACJAZO_003016 [Myxococcota bacterium]